ncbi:FAD-binding protein [Paenibacillus spongiae]|uniref:FAD-binding protein n=1 Tax=Paenibacillus spongiae TaxID=2909671 RepID=A0ABY5S5M6_9BACL|nr:FAD-binding protein [Paenibacillus spongiae]UVI29207.1 FAD-binding protein [Paenibacillus spongiae]
MALDIGSMPYGHWSGSHSVCWDRNAPEFGDLATGAGLQKQGVNFETCLKTIKEFNSVVRTDIPFNPTIKDGRCTVELHVPKSNWANTIEDGPFEAYAVTCGISFTFGGLKINSKAEVQDRGHNSIPGLYAAGELVGGLFYFNYPGGAGLMAGSVFGKIAGEQAAEHAKRRKSTSK